MSGPEPGDDILMGKEVPDGKGAGRQGRPYTAKVGGGREGDREAEKPNDRGCR